MRISNSNCKFCKNRKCFNIRCNPQVKCKKSNICVSKQILKYKKQVSKQLKYLNLVKCAQGVALLINKSCNKYSDENIDQIIGKRSWERKAEEEMKDLVSYCGNGPKEKKGTKTSNAKASKSAFTGMCTLTQQSICFKV